MTDESETSSNVPIAVGDRPESQTSKETTNNTAESPLRDELGDLLADRHRRYVLHCLATSETPMALADLADELVRWETDTLPTAVQEQRERVYVSLYHCHLPKLASSGLVSFDINRKLVDLREDADEHLLDLVRTGAEETTTLNIEQWPRAKNENGR